MGGLFSGMKLFLAEPADVPADHWEDIAFCLISKVQLSLLCCFTVFRPKACNLMKVSCSPSLKLSLSLEDHIELLTLLPLPPQGWPGRLYHYGQFKQY